MGSPGAQSRYRLNPSSVRHTGRVPRIGSPAAERIGSNMRAQRARKDMTVLAVAKQSGVDPSNITAYEQGRSMPNLRSLVRIAEALEVAPGSLVDGVTASMFERDDN